MAIWHHPNIQLEQLNNLSGNTALELLDIEFTEIGDDYLKARMPVDHRHRQPAGILHGGISVTLAESIASTGASMVIDYNRQSCVGLEINANHVRPVKDGFVEAIARPLHIGRRTHIWEIKITNADLKLVCVSRITMAILER